MPWEYLRHLSNIPDAMLHTDKGAIRQWVAWKAVDNPKKGKPDKVPIDPKTGRCASSTNPETWARFWDAVNFYRDWHGKQHSHRGAGGKILTGPIAGVGFVLTADDPFIGVDVDHCIVDGKIQPDALDIIETIGSYTEISPSGTGIRIFTTGKEPGEACRFGNVEIYWKDRYLTVTGNCLPGMEALKAYVQ